MISEYLQRILSARYGKDVRQSIHDGIKELDEVARTAQGSATLSAQTAIAKANEALTASQEAIESAKQAKAYADNAQAVAGVTVATQETAGLVKGGENHIALDGTLELVVKTTEASMPNSRKGRVEVVEIGGVSKQDNIPSSDIPQEVKKPVVSGIKTHGPQCFNIGSTSFLINGGSATDVIKTKSGVEYTAAVLGANVGVYSREYFNGEYTVSMDVTLSDNNFTNFVINSKLAIKGDDYTANTKRHVVIQNIYNDKSITMYLDNRNKAVGTRVVIENIMVTKGSVELPYEEYKESSITFSQPIELDGIGDVQDVITSKQTKRKFAEVVFDGSDDEMWTLSSSLAGRYVISLINANVKLFGNCLCTQGVQGVNNTQIVNECYISQYSAFVINTEFDTLDNWKAHLASKPMTLVYELAEEITEDLPLADQIALNSLATFDGVTYVEFDSEVQPTFKGNYGTSLVGGAALEGLLIARNNELRITALETSAVNNI